MYVASICPSQAEGLSPCLLRLLMVAAAYGANQQPHTSNLCPSHLEPLGYIGLHFLHRGSCEMLPLVAEYTEAICPKHYP